MDVTVHIPDDLVCRMTEAGGDLSRRALEGLALEQYKGGRITGPRTPPPACFRNQIWTAS